MADRRSKEFCDLAAKYRKFNDEWAVAETEKRNAEYRVSQSCEAMARLRKEMAGFVGNNIRVKSAIIDGVIVRVEYIPANEHIKHEAVHVTFEPITTSDS